MKYLAPSVATRKSAGRSRRVYGGRLQDGDQDSAVSVLLSGGGTIYGDVLQFVAVLFGYAERIQSSGRIESVFDELLADVHLVAPLDLPHLIVQPVDLELDTAGVTTPAPGVTSRWSVGNLYVSSR